MLSVSARQLQSWQRQGFLVNSAVFTFSDLIALRALQKLRENRVPPQRIRRALESLKRKLAGVRQPLSELKIVSDGRSVAVLIAGQKVEPVTGQLLFDFDTAELNKVFAFPEAKAEALGKAERLRQSEYWFQRGLEVEETGAPLREAIDAYEKALDYNSEAAGALVNLGTIHYHLSRLKDARRYYERAVEVDPKYPLAHFNLGNLYDEMGLLDRAGEQYAIALKLSPNYADAHYNMALLAERQGDYLRATRHWKAYLKIDPSSSWAAIARRQLERLRTVTVVPGGPSKRA